MGLFSILKRKPDAKKQKELPWEAAEAALIEKRKRSREKQNNVLEEIILDYKEQIPELRQHLAEAKQEYIAVSAYLTDIQKIETIPLEESGTLYDAARNLIALNKERQRFQHTERKILPEQYQRMLRYEDEIPAQLKKMEDQESYQQKIRNDMKQLEGEKGSLTYEREECRRKLEFAKKLSFYGCILVAVIFCGLFYVSDAVGKDMTIPFFLTGLMGLGIVTYVLLESRKSSRERVVAEHKINRAITLTNRVKLKFVNCTNALDFAYDKFGVNSYQELRYLWGQFVKAKEEEKRYRNSTELLHFYNATMIEELSQFLVADPEVWTYQPEALLESKEMVEVRHRLNERRQKLRDQISVMMEQIEEAEKLHHSD